MEHICVSSTGVIPRNKVRPQCDICGNSTDNVDLKPKTKVKAKAKVKKAKAAMKVKTTVEAKGEFTPAEPDDAI